MIAHAAPAVKPVPRTLLVLPRRPTRALCTRPHFRYNGTNPIHAEGVPVTLTILGLGPGHPDLLTREAWRTLEAADEIWLRTARHPTVDGLPSHLAQHSFDALYERHAGFADVYAAIVEQVLALARRPQGVLYAVPGHPLVGERTVVTLLERARAEAIRVRIVEGLSFVEPTLSALGVDALDGLQLADAIALAAQHHPALDPDRPALVGQLYSRSLASDVKLTLMNAYPDAHPVTLVQAVTTGEQTTTSMPLYELDRTPAVDHLTSLYVPPLPTVGGMEALLDTAARLRAPDGCPWDRQQTHLTLRHALLEEAYEVLAALDAEDTAKLCEELGDLLMQIVLHAQIAVEGGEFRFAEVVGSIDAKLKRRHPHVFAGLDVDSTEQVLRNWEAIKAEERAADPHVADSRLAGVPRALPALARAQALGDRAARVGFDWPDAEAVLDKLVEEVNELRCASDAETRQCEFGDLLFTLVNLARHLDVDAEAALRGTCNRFTERFAQMEAAVGARGQALDELSLAEQDALWEQAKRG
jgi:tetrapyrrole methylase family protein/MazG family protein